MIISAVSMVAECQPFSEETATMSDSTPTVSVSSHQCISFIKSSVCMNHIHYLWHHTTLFMTSSPLYMISYPLYLTSRPLYLCHHTHSIHDIIAKICMMSHPVYVWPPIHYIYDIRPSMYDITTLCWCHHNRHMYDIICTTDDITSILSHQTTLFMTSHPLQAWYHTHSIRHCTHCVYVIATSKQIPHPLLYDITPTLCLISYALYITSHPLLMSTHYCTYDSTTSIYETTSSMQGNLYTIHETSQPLICVITPTVLTTSHPIFVWYHTRHMYSIFCTIEDITSSIYDIKSPFLWHQTHYIWHHIHGVSDIISTVLMISHQMYLWDLICYIWWHHIHCIQHHIHYICNITATVSVSHTPSFHDITPFVCMI